MDHIVAIVLSDVEQSVEPDGYETAEYLIAHESGAVPRCLAVSFLLVTQFVARRDARGPRWCR